ncbi:MAG: type III pantothenate kinase [Nitrospirae bacterium]|nr:MAG: type III pantothenate kinase [Nitrospirota bacterium]
MGRPPHVVSHRSPHGLAFGVPEPARAGADRLATAAGALARTGPPLLVVDCGTATTCTVVDRGAGGEPLYRGGAIAPGVGAALEGLRRRAGHLPEPAAEPEVPGTTTEAALALGAVAGHAWMVEAVVERLAAACAAPPKLFLTGGWAPRLRPHLAAAHEFRPDLCLEGLLAIGGRLGLA